MKIRFSIPQWLSSRYRPIDRWLNSVAARPLQLEVRVIDILLAFGFVACVLYYAFTTGWQGAIVGGLLYILMAMMALWVF